MMERNFRPGDRVQVKSENECILGTVIEVNEDAVTVQLEEVSHTVVIEKYSLDTLQLCDDK
jgi:hypothetical protein